jgi:uncharacterized protein YprB with RNaseH-like and TPR domain
MIENTFIILKGIGSVTERRLWQKDILTWEDFIAARSIKRISEQRKETYDNQLEKARENLKIENAAYFSQCLDAKEHWRLYGTWKDRTCFLDIETTGLYHGITVVGVYSTKGYQCFVRGINLEREVLKRELEEYKMLVTFYGRAFDMPFIERELGITLEVPHLDLCFAGKKVGLRGGLKKVEQQVGIEREESIFGLDGYDAVQLWKEYERGDGIALDTLLEYNMADTVNLKALADIVYDRLKAQTFLSTEEQSRL